MSTRGVSRRRRVQTGEAVFQFELGRFGVNTPRERIMASELTDRRTCLRDTRRGLWYEDGKLVKILEAGRYVIPRYLDLGFYRRPKVEVVLVDVRERDLTIKGQEILTADKVAIRPISIPGCR